ncbi:MAG: nucleotide sugar dehydrogenase [Acidimicrobiia bacterium]|nr:MAG: nucleotide sugar dehydrogenase [Acidimicrobiia bacterium]
MTVAVIALGKIGLPVAVQIARAGLRVIGVDTDPRVVELVSRGDPPFPGEEGLDVALREAVEKGFFQATTRTEDAVREAEVIVVLVPLVVDEAGQPDFRGMDAATDAIGRALQHGALVSYETTLPVGTTRTRFAPHLERASGLKAGRDFHLVHSPERVFSGRVFRDLRRYPKLVGGLTDACTDAGVRFYRKVLDFDDRPDLPRPNGVWGLASAEAAEMAKLAETTYRDVNIALANEFARFAEENGLDVYEVIEAANSQPFSRIHRPGVAVGGHCIPVYPRFYMLEDSAARLPKVAREVNLAVPARVVTKVGEHLGGLRERVVLVLGASYRGGVKETAFSGVFDLIAEIHKYGGIPVVHDPLYSADELRQLGMTPYELGQPIDAAILQADHREYMGLKPADLPGCKVIYDGRGVLDAEVWEGVTFLQIGVGSPTAAKSSATD